VSAIVRSSGQIRAAVTFNLITFSGSCDYYGGLVTETTTPTETATVTDYETVYTPGATVTTAPTATVTVTPDAVTVTATETEEVDLCVLCPFSLLFVPSLLIKLLTHSGPDYYTEDVIVVTTPLTSTVRISTVRSPPSPSSPSSPSFLSFPLLFPFGEFRADFRLLTGRHQHSLYCYCHRDLDSRHLHRLPDIGSDDYSASVNFHRCSVRHRRSVFHFLYLCSCDLLLTCPLRTPSGSRLHSRYRRAFLSFAPSLRSFSDYSPVA
jgi:hypothetical protein